MTAALLGLLTAVCWGCADFIARFTGRALGHRSALLGMLVCSALALLAIFLASGRGLPAGGLSMTAWLLVLATGVGLALATLLLYDGLAHGPVTIVSAIVASYPAFNLALALLTGARPDAWQWTAMAAALAGVLIVAASATGFVARYSRAALRRSVLLALGSALCFALTIAAGQAAAGALGELQTLLLARWVAVAAALTALLWRRERPRLMPDRSVRWPALLLLQGLLDGAAYLALLAAGQGAPGAVAALVGSGFGAVTVVLARVFLREPMTARQWFGIVLIVGGVALLSAPR